MNQLFDELAFAIGVALILAGIAAIRRTRRLVAGSRTASGRISGYDEDDSDDGIWYFSRIRFRDEAGVEHEIRGPHGSQEPPEVGAVVPITYDPAYPANAWPTGSCAPWVLGWLIVLLGIAGVIAGFVIRAES
jgi:hypothetical protein